MLLILLHPGDLTLWELLLVLAGSAVLLLAFVGLPLCLIGYVFYKVAQHRREMAQSKSPEPMGLKSSGE